ncbi:MULTISPECIES: hypothetical protein [unclassified Coleofasciculus]|uniref:hypothetical protein n=1 Tax=unclassified Coleofasciculus TaxID=2692782 RepID=UPI00187E6968|nr:MULTISPECIES: hypothetical protein [unclassified Coleofasciculus]MBE9124741.1 hypothetical protein [Coleofasciculus sp. LEGE 07081]MBE9148193.1 hypothetical protein [Coleofasciculus sp. LEGE 07092]
MNSHQRITDETVNHHWAHSASVFFASSLASRLIKIAILQSWTTPTLGRIFACTCLMVAVGYWGLWFLSELNEIIPRENHRNLFNRRRFTWAEILQKTNFLELTYRVSVLSSLVLGFALGQIK